MNLSEQEDSHAHTHTHISPHFPVFRHKKGKYVFTSYCRYCN